MNYELQKHFPVINNLEIIPPCYTRVYSPPVRFEGSVSGHVGEGDLFLYLETGTLFLVVGKEHYVLRPGQLAFLPDGEFRAYTPTSSDYILYAYTMYIKAEGENLFKYLNLAGDTFVVTPKNPDRLIDSFRRSSTRIALPLSTESLVNSAEALNIAAEYISARIQKSHKENPFAAVEEKMRSNPDGRYTLEELALCAGMHPTHFIRKFKEYYGVTPMHYYSELRCNHAMDLLADNSLDVEVVGKLSGFEDKYYFIKFFERMCGINPDEYRKILEYTK